MTRTPVEELDALVIGAGVTGLYQLYCLRQLGLNARIYEAGDGVGGTWYWNRYPGARLDSESWSYAYSFSDELLQEWDWTESFVGQPELERYLNRVADKFHLRPHIRLGTRVRSTIFAGIEVLPMAPGTTRSTTFPGPPPKLPLAFVTSRMLVAAV